MIKKILFITLSNIGDVILTLPVLDLLKENFPQASITVMVGPRPKDIFENNPYIHQTIVYDKHSLFRDKFSLFKRLRRERFDMIVDLRNSVFGAVLPAKYKISPFATVPRHLAHMQLRHLYKVQLLLRRMRGRIKSESHETILYPNASDRKYIKDLLLKHDLFGSRNIVIISPGARSHTKRWPADNYVKLIDSLVEEFQVNVIVVGDRDDAHIARYLTEHCFYPIMDLTGKTTIMQLAHLLRKAKLLITNDSAALHMGSYLNIPVLAIFGPTDERKYGPWSDNHNIARKNIYCVPCRKAQCRFGTLSCINTIKVGDVLRLAGNLLADSIMPKEISAKSEYKRILVMRTDRLGDVLLTTPVVKALREHYPQAYIAMMVTPYTKDAVDGNIFLDEVIVYDKYGRHKGWAQTIKFARQLSKKRFDLVLLAHPSNRSNLVAFIAGIRRRIGFDRKMGFLLTDRIKHTKQFGEKHEVEYSLDLVRHLGIEPKDKQLYIPIKQKSEEWVDDVFKREGIKHADRILVIQPGASCPSRIWPAERFAQVADKLAGIYNMKVLIVNGPDETKLSDAVFKNMHSPVVNLGGKTSISQMASIFKRSTLVISNDSGPVHIASAVGVPVISIFSRSQKGISPERWGPVGKKDRYIHRKVGCIECLAHNCVKGFACLKAITVDDVVAAAKELLN